MNNRHSSIQSLVLGSVIFSLVFAVASACVAFFFPSETAEVSVSSGTSGLASAGLSSSDETAFILEKEKLPVIPEAYEFYPGIDGAIFVHEASFAENDFVSHAEIISHAQKLSLIEDQGLLLYREPQTRGVVEWFYTSITGDRDVSMAILKFAEEYQISLSLAFALAYTESQYNPDASHVNSNSSIDRGLFQLNDESFPNLMEDQFFDPYTSAKYGLSHLRYCLNSAGNEIAALAMYNAGPSKVRKNGTPHTTLNYISKIQDYRTALDTTFAMEVGSFYSEDIFSPKQEFIALR